MRILGTTTQRTSEIAVDEMHLPITAGDFYLQFQKLSIERLSDVAMLKGRGVFYERFFQVLALLKQIF